MWSQSILPQSKNSSYVGRYHAESMFQWDGIRHHIRNVAASSVHSSSVG